MHEALFYKKTDSNRLECYLCPHYCRLKPGQNGFCHVRKNVSGTLQSLVYGKPYAVNVDPIEKKPLYHFLPGSKILSVGTAGCNMACKHCQNWDLSETHYEESRAVDLSPERLVQMSSHYNSRSIAYTYNEPTIFAEYVMDTARLSQKYSIRNVMVTNGYITLEVLDEVYENIDAANVDLKAFNEKFYTRQTLSHLQPVLDTLKRLKELNKWIEITTLVIPEHNDSDKEIGKMCKWILSELGWEVPLHLTAFHPDFKFTHVPATKPSTLLRLRDLAMDSGLKYVYVGNVSADDAGNTYCHNCSQLVIERTWHFTETPGLRDGKCRKCQTTIPGIFNQ